MKRRKRLDKEMKGAVLFAVDAVEQYVWPPTDDTGWGFVVVVIICSFLIMFINNLFLFFFFFFLLLRLHTIAVVKQ